MNNSTTAPWEPAKTLRDVRRLSKLGPLSGPELAAFWEDTDAARDANCGLRVALGRVLEEANADLRLLVYGHGGAGKSTELIKLQEELADAFFTVRFSVKEHFNIEQIVPEDVPVVLAERVMQAAEDNNLPLTTEQLQPIYEWFAVTTITEKTGTDAALKAKSEVKLGSPLEFLKLLASFQSEIKVGSSRGNEKIRELRNNRGELLEKVNLFLNEVRGALPPGKKLLIIVEDMDKLNIAKANELFIKNSSLLAGINSNVIYTIPIFTFHSPEAGAIKSAFDGDFGLKMLKVCEAGTTERAAGFAVVRNIVRKRIPAALLPDDALDLAVQKTGGVLRHLFEVINYAANMTNFSSETDPLTAARIQYGLNKRKSELLNEIAIPYDGVPNHPDLVVDELFERLAVHYQKRVVSQK